MDPQQPTDASPPELDAPPAPTPQVAAPSQPPASPPPAAPPVGAAPPVAAAPAPAPVVWQAAPADAAPGPMPGIGFAPHVGRLIAYLIDGLIIGIVVAIVALLLTPLLVAGANSDDTGALVATAFLYTFVVLLVSVSYFPFFWSRGGQTPGMRFFRLRVVRDADGGSVNGGTAVIRLIGLWISFLVFYLGIIWILVDSRRRGWHDLLAGTVVIHQP